MKASTPVTRRTLLRTGLAAGAGLTLAAGTAGGTADETTRAPAPEARFRAKPLERVRIGLVGVGNMGMNHVHNLLAIEGCRIQAVCDIVPEKFRAVQDLVKKAGHPEPTGYSRICVLQGTRGIVRNYPDPRIHLEGRSPAHAWERSDGYRPEFEHPLWKALGKVAHDNTTRATAAWTTSKTTASSSVCGRASKRTRMSTMPPPGALLPR